MQILMGLIGMVALLAIAVLLSNNRKAINLRTVLGAWIIQVGIGALILYVPAGRSALLAMSNGVASVIAYGNEGISFIFGGLVSDKMFEVFGGGGFVFALRVLPVIVFFSSLIAVLYYLGIMQLVIRILGGALRAVLKTSRTESLSATLQLTASAMSPKPSMLWRAASRLISAATTLAPCSAKWRTIARPMPWPAPVTNATLFSSFIVFSHLPDVGPPVNPDGVWEQSLTGAKS